MFLLSRLHLAFSYMPSRTINSKNGVSLTDGTSVIFPTSRCQVVAYVDDLLKKSSLAPIKA